MELNAEQIKKALEWLEWLRCNARYSDEAEIELTISLIKELTEENDRLKALHTVDKEYKFCNLVGDTLIYNKTLEDYNKLRADFRADTVRKMHSMIKERCIKGGIYPSFVESTIDQIEKEMLEGENEGSFV
jgi:hypothetical protein